MNNTYEDYEGTQDTVIYYKNDFLTYKEYADYNLIENVREEPFVYYSIDENRTLAILTLNECNFNDEYCKCLKDMFKEVKEKGIENVAVDLRYNGGGNSLVANRRRIISIQI